MCENQRKRCFLLRSTRKGHFVSICYRTVFIKDSVTGTTVRDEIRKNPLKGCDLGTFLRPKQQHL